MRSILLSLVIAIFCLPSYLMAGSSFSYNKNSLQTFQHFLDEIGCIENHLTVQQFNRLDFDLGLVFWEHDTAELYVPYINNIEHSDTPRGVYKFTLTYPDQNKPISAPTLCLNEAPFKLTLEVLPYFYLSNEVQSASIR